MAMTIEGNLRDSADEALVTDIEAIRHVVDMCLALDADASLRALVLRGAKRRAFAQTFGSACLLVTERGLTLSRDASETSHAPSLDDLLRDVSLSVAANRPPSSLRPKKRADRMIQALLRGERAGFVGLLAWAPVVEQIAYRATARISTMLDEDRGSIIQQRYRSAAKQRQLLRRYWALATLMSRLTLLATTSGASSWLTEMSQSFVWTQWTPSIVLVRERLLGFATIGGRAAAEFGPGVLAGYEGALDRSRVPTLALDAVLGITAIALRHPTTREDCRLIMRNRLQAISRRNNFEDATVLLGLRQALRLIDESQEHRGAKSSIPRDFYADAFTFSSNGECLAIAALPGALADQAWTALPPQRTQAGPTISDALGKELFARAWGPSLSPVAEYVLH